MRALIRSFAPAAVIALLAATLSAMVAGAPAASAGDAVPLLPDLRMAKLGMMFLQITPEGRRELRFDTTVVNLGAGPLEVLGSRATTSDPMTVTQRIHDSAGGYSDVPTSATMFFAGDGHTHWHVKDFETYVLRRDGQQVGQSIKSGYCFFDTVHFAPGLPGSPASGTFDPASVCARDQPDALAAQAGLSVGWGDLYRANLPDQFIDVTDLEPGIYRLVVIADRDGAFTESDDTNNRTWVRMHIGLRRVVVLGRGAGA